MTRGKMANPFSVDFYPDRFLMATARWTHAQAGAYARLLFNQIHGRFTEQEVVSILGDKDLWEFLKVKFEKDSSGMYYNLKMEEEIEKKRKFLYSRSENAKKRYDKPAHAGASAYALVGSGTGSGKGIGGGEKKGVQGEGKKEYPKDFEAFWAAYPRKIGKGGAFRSWTAAIKISEPIIIIAGVEKYKATLREKMTDEKYIAHPATWLNQRRWEDQTGINTEPMGRPEL